jgi:hypothetical protein
MDAQVYGRAWLQYFRLLSALDGQLVCNCCEQEPRAPWQDKASFTLPILASRCCLGWFHCFKVCGDSEHGCRHIHKGTGLDQSAELHWYAWIGVMLGLEALH